MSRPEGLAPDSVAVARLRSSQRSLTRYQRVREVQDLAEVEDGEFDQRRGEE